VKDLLACRSCRRLTTHLDKLQKAHPDWHNAPVPATGPEGAALLIVGLAPGQRGANRTGVPFVGDPSSFWLRDRLTAAGLIDGEGRLRRVRITNAVKCLPPANRPNAAEIRTCTDAWLTAELQAPGLRSILCLGGVAHRAVCTALGIRQKDHPFSHGARHAHASLLLLSSFHPSPLNTQTGRLSAADFDAVLQQSLAGDGGSSNQVTPASQS
jgi:uracil-DNA glycosylase family 4